ncbi:MAG TPA: sugar transferase [Candidatus Sulfotelmatobacter sp.]|nr:sugar transferase [Candidatus Sulfotelmatobacter sp.]
MNSRRSNGSMTGVAAAPSLPVCERVVLGEESFQRTLSIERKRTERSKKPFLLMLLNFGTATLSEGNRRVLGRLISALSDTTRATDIVGWHKEFSVIGVLYTEIIIDDHSSTIKTMMNRVSDTLSRTLTLDQLNQISISFHVFPEPWDGGSFDRPSNPTLYPDFSELDDRRKYQFAVKRTVDVVASGIGLILTAPIFLVIAALVKLSSNGPVFFRQQRIGQHGLPFTFLKFRTMYVNNDHSAHKEYVKKLIAGNAHAHSNGNGNGNGAAVYKITADPRVTRIGKFLRRSSLDELPQLINVLIGEMSLVGPRPPIAYEVQAYDIWHRGRLMEAKPGITGLWQVSGRCRVKFDEMVRLDIRYARTWSLWLDLKILLRTPRAVFLGEGAY